MIDRPALIAWRSEAPWPNPVQIEQDLLLSRLMIEIARNDVLGPELAMRGGTCLHKLHLPTPLRYSEDLDYVRRTHTGIKPYTQALGDLAERLGLIVSSRQRSGQMVHVYLDAQPTEGVGRIRIKIEMNIAETEPHRPLKAIRHTVNTSWWSGEADIPTYETSELLATKLRALYQRSKGRDLFDLWLGLTVLKIDPDQIVAGFNHYMRENAFSFPELRGNLAAKLGSTRFLRDLNALVTNTPTGYDPDTAADLVMRELGSRLRNAPPADEIAPLGRP
ncbi:MAG TPA: nucleotidyl transferase AbiEii/AbiGii toxin family protein [Solirubrobacteraceae bacterium]|nr:nucleotidyl transferase AbiEii/AbiGii toxin family protein [Solirubrobacteraceae bacterium]